MKISLMALVLMLFSVIAFSQLNPVKWTFDAVKTGAGEYELKFNADIKEGWVIYSQFLESEDGPVPTSFTFEETGGVALEGKIEEKGHLKEDYDDIFGMVLKKLDGDVVFIQKVNNTKPGSVVKGYLTYMTCDNERCLPPKDVEFKFDLK